MKSTNKLPRSRFPRHEPKANLEQAEQMLFEEMEYAAELLQNREDFGRSGVLHALHACYSFLHVRGLSGQALKPLYDVVTTFEGVEEGNLPELFDPMIKRGDVPERKWSRSHAAGEIKIHAAAQGSSLMSTNISLDPPRQATRSAKRFWKASANNPRQAQPIT